MSEYSHKEILVVCRAGQKSVHIKINANKLVVCPLWKTCPAHGQPGCQEQQMHDEITGKTRKEKYKQRRKR